MRLNYRPLEVIHQKALRRKPDESRLKALRGFPVGIKPQPKAHDTVMVGRKEALAPILAAPILTRIHGAFMGPYPREDDPGHYVFVISWADMLAKFAVPHWLSPFRPLTYPILEDAH